jgi:hypothetical protein
LRFSARLFFVLIWLTGLSLAQSHTPDDGVVEDNVYTNFFFQVRFPFSASWVPQSATVVNDLEEITRVHLPNAAKGAHNLLTLFRSLPGGGPNIHGRAIIAVLVEDVSSRADVRNSSDYVTKLADGLHSAGEIRPGTPQEVKLGGRTFYRLDLKSKSPTGAPVYHALVFTMTKGYALGFFLSSPTQPLLTNMAATLDQTKFY